LPAQLTPLKAPRQTALFSVLDFRNEACEASAKKGFNISSARAATSPDNEASPCRRTEKYNYGLPSSQTEL
ncbi:MAG: hypothetical protein WCJ07_11140, partial [Verrucomicrobiota bacterium]